MTVAFIVFCFFFPETNARRPPASRVWTVT
jgi:hypothetical protein